MGRQRSQIEIVERQISVVDHDMSVLLAELGMHILTLRQPVVTGDSVSAYQQLVKEKSILDEYDARILHLQQIGQSLQDASSRMAQLKGLINEHEKLLREVYGRVGVIAWEEASSGVLSDVIREVLPKIDEMQERVATLKRTKESMSLKSSQSSHLFKLPLKFQEFVASRKLERFSHGHEEFFIEMGQVIAESMGIKHLKSNAAVELDKRYQSLSREMGVFTEEMSLMEQRISEDRSSLEEVGAAGSFDRKVVELQNSRKSQSELVRTLAMAYGRTVCSMDNPWKAVDVDAETLRCYDQIRRHERIRGQLESRIEDLKIEQQIGELILLIDEDEERIDHLRQLIDQHNRQIEDIQRSIGSRRERIVELKHALATSLEQEEL